MPAQTEVDHADGLITRRGFLAAAGAMSVLAGCGAAARTGTTPKLFPDVPPPAPKGAQSFVSRPDLRPTALVVAGGANFAKAPGSPGYIFVAPRSLGSPGKAQEGPMILDLQGDLVWFRPMTKAVFNLTPQIYKGRPVLTWWSGVTGPTYGHGGYTVADTSYRTVATVSGADGLEGDLHEFGVTPEDTALFTAYRTAHVAGQSVVEGFAFEVDIATGHTVLGWRSLAADHVPTSESYAKAKRGTGWDYFHINSVSLWPGPERDLLVSARNTCAIYRISRRTGHIVWRLGGKRSDFALDAKTRFWWQHDARALSDGSGVSVFDDASNPPERSAGDPQSRALVLGLDPAVKSVTLRAELLHPDTPESANEAAFMGNCQVLPNGGYFVGWGGDMPYFSGYVPAHGSGRPHFALDGRFPSSWFSYRSYVADWVGRPPVDELALQVRPAPGGSHRWHAYASWNGATEVANWELLAGSTADRMTRIGTFARSGFETVMNAEVSSASGSTGPSFQVRALDNTGGVLGESGAVRAT